MENKATKRTNRLGRGLSALIPDISTEIDKKDIKFCKNEDAFYYIWGWPGPDANLYYFKDYGITWAFNEEDFRKEEVGHDSNC